jgi:translation initiation factor IF-3
LWIIGRLIGYNLILSKIRNQQIIKKNNKKPLINEQIDAKSVILINNGHNLGEVGIKEALTIAKSKNEDLVVVVEKDGMYTCKILEYGKLVYQKKKNKKQAHKTKQQLKTIKLRPSIGYGDLKIKAKQINKFVAHGDKVKVVVVFKGREYSHAEIGLELISSITELLTDKCLIEKQIKGTSISLNISPSQTKL